MLCVYVHIFRACVCVHVLHACVGVFCVGWITYTCMCHMHMLVCDEEVGLHAVGGIFQGHHLPEEEWLSLLEKVTA